MLVTSSSNPLHWCTSGGDAVQEYPLAASWPDTSSVLSMGMLLKTTLGSFMALLPPQQVHYRRGRLSLSVHKAHGRGLGDKVEKLRVLLSSTWLTR
eukprot:3447723-Amphidinium_carterae.1